MFTKLFMAFFMCVLTGISSYAMDIETFDSRLETLRIAGWVEKTRSYECERSDMDDVKDIHKTNISWVPDDILHLLRLNPVKKEEVLEENKAMTLSSTYMHIDEDWRRCDFYTMTVTLEKK